MFTRDPRPHAAASSVAPSATHAGERTLDTQAARRMYRRENINEIWDAKVTAREGLIRV